MQRKCYKNAEKCEQIKQISNRVTSIHFFRPPKWRLAARPGILQFTVESRSQFFTHNFTARYYLTVKNDISIKVKNDKIEVSMEDYASSLEPIVEIRKAERTENLTNLELKEYRKYTGKISWLAQGSRQDLSYSALKLAKKNNSATIAD